MKKYIYFVKVFFDFFGHQNDYLYPPKKERKNPLSWTPYKRPHLWKTRFGFKTSWDLAKICAL